MIVTIDGPAGSGKSTAARGLAARLDFEFLDTGAMYRAIAFALRRAGIDCTDEPRVQSLLQAVQLEMLPGVVRLDGEDVTRLIRTPDMNAASSRVAAVGIVRRFLVERQREIARLAQMGRGRSLVCEGRDQGTVVFPDATCKFFLVADVHARAERRYWEMINRGIDVTREQVLAEQQERDERDSSRLVDPLRPAADAVVIDTSAMEPGEVLNTMEEEVRRCIRG